MATKTETIRSGLARNGWTLIPGTSKKYECYEKVGEASRLFLGKAGALRRGRVASDTIPVSPLFIEQLTKV